MPSSTIRNARIILVCCWKRMWTIFAFVNLCKSLMLSSHTLTEKTKLEKKLHNASEPVLAIRPSFLVVKSVVTSKSILEDLHKDTTNTAIEENWQCWTTGTCQWSIFLIVSSVAGKQWLVLWCWSYQQKNRQINTYEWHSVQYNKRTFWWSFLLYTK